MKKKNGNGAIGNPFAALKHRNYRYYWIGMAISTTGTWMQNVAQPWLAYKLTDSAFLLGLVSALQFLPVLLFSLFAGVIIDRSKKKNILYMTQSASFVITLSLTILTYSGHIMYWHLIVSSALLGIVNTFDLPTRQSFVIELVGREDLTNGIALNSMQINLARVIGPAIAGVIMGAGPQGIPNCFLINAVSFGAVLLSLWFIHPHPIERQLIKEDNILRNIEEGLKFIYSRKVLFLTLLIVAITGTFVMNENVLIPVFSVQVLHQHEAGFGLLMSMIGVGALAGALTMASIAKDGPRKFFIYCFPVITGVLVLMVGFTSLYALTGVTLLLIGFFFIIFIASANSIIQLNSTNEYRGRVMSVFSLVVGGTTPIGNLFAGGIAQSFNASVSFIACGAVTLVLLAPVLVYLTAKGGIEPIPQK
ncbi:MAG: MFS transporter [Desulfosporosinus sp.]|nr:MFS transporter [Desulfosporosinus sp.]